MIPRSGGATAFADWPLKQEILDSIAGMGFATPTEIQSLTIPKLLDGRDVIGQAKTGTGKTAAFGLPILNNLKLNVKEVQALVLAPTRELAEQVSVEIKEIGKNLGIGIAAIYGGTKYEGQIRSLRQGSHIVVGTPGRIMDLMRQGILHVNHIRFLVLDEADRMLDMGFLEDIQWILKHCPPRQQRQTMLFSATVPEAIRQIAQDFMRSPEYISTAGDQTTSMAQTADLVQQEYYSVGRRNKLWALSRVLEHEKSGLMLIFCATKRMVDLLAEDLEKLGYPVEALHGDLSQNRRTRVLEKFRDAKVKILVATDVAARGLDIDGITHVINYDLPEEPEVYVHRIGRTARMGKTGKAISFVSKHDRHQLELVQNLAGGLMELREPPEAPEGEKTQDRVRKVIDWDHISDKYGNVHFRVGLGRKDGATLTLLHKLVRGAGNIPDYLINGIKIHDEDATFNVPKDYAVRTLQGLRSNHFNGKRFRAEIEPQS